MSVAPISESGRRRLVIAAIAAAALAELLLQIFFMLRRAPLVGDEGNYLFNALAIARGDFGTVSAYNSPLYSVLAAVPVALGVDPEIACRAVNAIAVVALVAITGVVAGAIFTPLAGVLAAWMIVSCPLVAWMGNSALSEPTATVFATAALALVARRFGRREWEEPVLPEPGEGARSGRDTGATSARFVAAGVLGVVAMLGRSELGYVVLLVGACALWGGHRPRRAVAMVVAGAAVCALLAFAALSSAGWARGYFSKGTIVVSLAGRGLFDDPATAERVVYGLTPDFERAVDAPGRSLSPGMLLPTARRALRQWPKMIENLVTECASPLPLLLAPLALFAIGWPASRRVVPWALGLAAALPIAISSCVEPVPRYLLPCIPFLMTLAAGGVTHVVLERRSPLEPRSSSSPHRPRSFRHVALWFALLVLVPLPWALGRTLNGIASIPRVYRETGIWMRDHLERGRLLARPGTYISYYAGVPEYTWMPAAGIRETLAHARKKEIRYLVLDGRLSLAARPGFAELLAGETEAPRRLGLRGVYTNGRKDADRIIVYEILPGEVPDSVANDEGSVSP